MMAESSEVLGFINGALTTGFVVAAVFFLKFWSRTRDRLFATFAAAFALLGLAQPLPMFTGAASEGQALIYLLRLSAFALIIWAILRKNLDRES